eukprot:scaffold7381_cov310-Pinguiococcus_pyrenoidosus.AAC.112
MYGVNNGFLPWLQLAKSNVTGRSSCFGQISLTASHDLWCAAAEARRQDGSREAERCRLGPPKR